MAWDLKIDHETGDLAAGYVTGQDEIIQRVATRLWRHLGEWFANTSAGLPWYEGPSELMEGFLTRENGMLGSRNFERVNLLVRNEIYETEGVIRIVDFNTSFDNTTGTYSIRVKIATQFGVSGVIPFDFKATA